MCKRFQENLRLLAALSCLLALASVAHASLIPQGVDLWFSTNTYSMSFKNGVNFMAPDNLYSTSGSIALTNGDLLKAFDPARWFMSFGHGLDALTVVQNPGSTKSEVYFSTGRTFFSRTFGRNIGEGDLLSRNGYVVATNQDLVAKFAPNGENFGLDAVNVINPGENREIVFSTRKDFYSNALGKTVGAGDLLSDSGKIIATNTDLLADFSPRDAGKSYGLDAAYIYKYNEDGSPVVWFSTNQRFFSQSLNRWVTPGDLLSNDGQIVATIAELMGNFGSHFPANPGLDVIAFAPGSSSGNLQAGRTDISRQLPKPVPAGQPIPTVPDPATLCLLAVGAAVSMMRRR